MFAFGTFVRPDDIALNSKGALVTLPDDKSKSLRDIKWCVQGVYRQEKLEISGKCEKTNTAYTLVVPLWFSISPEYVMSLFAKGEEKPTDFSSVVSHLSMFSVRSWWEENSVSPFTQKDLLKAKLEELAEYLEALDAVSVSFKGSRDMPKPFKKLWLDSMPGHIELKYKLYGL